MYKFIDKYLLASDGSPRTDNIPNHPTSIASDAAKHIEEHRKPALRLCAQEYDVFLCVREGDGVRERWADVRVDKDFERFEHGGAKLWLAVEEL